MCGYLLQSVGVDLASNIPSPPTTDGTGMSDSSVGNISDAERTL